MIILPIIASILWMVYNFLSEWLLRRRAPPGSRLPPMPPASSYRGHVEFFRPDFHRTICLKWAKEYGHVFRIKINVLNVVILNDYENIKKVFNRKEFLYRSHIFAGNRDSYKGLGSLNGEAWSANRRYCLSMLRDLGFAKTAMEGHMMEEFRRVADKIGEAHGKPLDLNEFVVPCAFNNIVSFFYGDLFTHDHPMRSKLHGLMNQAAVVLFAGSGHHFLPKRLRQLLAWVPFTQEYRIAEVMAKLDALSKEQIEAYKMTKSGEKENDFILGYVKKIQESKNESNSFFTDGYLVGNINSFLMAGTFSTSMTMTWQMINFAKHPDTVQARVQREIDEVIGHDRRPTWEDRKRMPYTMACVLEVQRWKTPSALGVARECAEDVVIGDIFIPKGTIVLPNMWAVHNDPILWKEPTKFYPERYLSEDRKSLLHKPQHYIPFSIGQRACAGETFAKMEIFLLITFLLQKYCVVAEHPVECDLDAPETEIWNINHIKLRFLPRKLGTI
ncbi:cytochrome P450 2U1 [Rhipicephalus microplus]|uniref:cytochrome P450 2U1 n=1 Tax=Rhipicephalus microplus TaxID=6941 RepID=UPI003F6BD85D